MTITPAYQLTRPPATRDELWELVYALWGVKIPRVSICPGHNSPFDAFAHAYFAQSPNWALWYGSRGCLAGDTIVTVNRAGNSIRQPIKDVVAYENSSDHGGRKRTPGIDTYVQRAEGDYARLGRIAQAWDSGVKTTYRLTTATGRSIRATAEHPFLGPDGTYTPLDCLHTGSQILVNVGRGHANNGADNHVLDRIDIDTVKSISRYGEEPTYDLTMAEAPNNYIANGFVVHNTGKSYMLAILGLTKAVVSEINVTLLGGSMAQSQNVQEHVENLLLGPNAPSWAVLNQIQTEITFTGGNWIRPLPASQKTVRGPHPHMTLLDEIDEMDKAVYDAAMGQAMEKPNTRGIHVPEMVVASSTWQYPVGTFQAVKDDAEAKGLPVFTWCYKEILQPHGWMTQDFIDRKRNAVPIEMFRVEYDLGEPSGTSRAFDLTKLEEAFIQIDTVDERHTGSDDEWIFEQPLLGIATYAAGADWAKERDKTVIVVYRTDVYPRRVVYLRRINRRPWPEMVGYFNDVTGRYQAGSAHDGTGIGNVVADYIDERSLKVLMIGRDRTELLTDYINAVEKGRYELPRNTPAYLSHKSTKTDEVYAPGKWNSHLADDVAAFALAHRAAERMPPPAAAVGVARDSRVSHKFAPVTPNHEERVLYQTGDVTVVDDSDDVGVFRLW